MLRENLRAARILSLIQGILLVIVGIIFFRNPFTSLFTLTILLGVFAVVSGIIGIIRYFSYSAFNSAGFLIIAILEIIFGVLLITGTPTSPIVLAYMLGFLVLFGSISQIVTSLDLNSLGINNWWIGLIAGILGIIVSIILLRNPELSTIYLAIYFIVTGITLIIAFFTLGSLKDDIQEKIDENN